MIIEKTIKVKAIGCDVCKRITTRKFVWVGDKRMVFCVTHKYIEPLVDTIYKIAPDDPTRYDLCLTIINKLKNPYNNE